MSWEDRLRREAIRRRYPQHELLDWAGLDPPVPPEYRVHALVGLTFRLGVRRGVPEYATLLDLAAAVRLGARLGLDAGAAIAMVDSHERVHVALQLDYERLHEVPPDVEEGHTRLVDAAWLACAHPRAEALLERMGGVLESAGSGFWDALADPEAP